MASPFDSDHEHGDRIGRRDGPDAHFRNHAKIEEALVGDDERRHGAEINRQCDRRGQLIHLIQDRRRPEHDGESDLEQVSRVAKERRARCEEKRDAGRKHDLEHEEHEEQRH
jgi:hypothetical protein